jgi:hypothetical protein
VKCVLVKDFLFHIPYARHHNMLLITNRCWILTIQKNRHFRKNLLEDKELVFKKGGKSIKAAAYNGARMVYVLNVFNSVYYLFSLHQSLNSKYDFRKTLATMWIARKATGRRPTTTLLTPSDSEFKICSKAENLFQLWEFD